MNTKFIHVWSINKLAGYRMLHCLPLSCARASVECFNHLNNPIRVVRLIASSAQREGRLPSIGHVESRSMNDGERAPMPIWYVVNQIAIRHANQIPAAAAAPMAPSEGRRSNVCVWIISCLLFLNLLAGGGFLVLYITLPETEDTIWFPIAGMILVAIPWVFWTITCIYQSIKTRNGGEKEPAAEASALNSPVAAAAHDSPIDSPGGARKVRFGNAIVVGDGGEAAGKALGGEKADHGGSNTRSDGESSVHSHESEAPLAFSMSSAVWSFARKLKKN